jgi:hypothetical protein
MAHLITNAMQGDIPLLFEAMSKPDGCWTADEKLELLDCIWIRTSADARSFSHVLGTDKINVGLHNTNLCGKNVLHVLAENWLVTHLDTFSRDKWITAVQRHMTDPSLLHARYRHIGWQKNSHPLPAC